MTAAEDAARRRAEYRATWEAQQRRLADPEFLPWLRAQLAALRERTGRG